MRLKHIPWAQDEINKHSELITINGEEYKGQWQARFEKRQPIHLEVGSGKGRFITEMAKRHPHINFIGLELQSSAIIKALEKQIENRLPNLQLLNGNANHLTDYFETEEISKVMLTFSDPWPKARHEKRRLTHANYLKQYQQILTKAGEFYFKTDNQGLFEYSLTSLNNYGMTFNEVILDLHNSEQAEDNIMTEFEEKFSKKGFRIYQIRAQFTNPK